MTRWLLLTYPPSFRHRYGDELAALIDDTGGGWRAGLDLIHGAARAWIMPAFNGSPQKQRHDRMQSTVMTAFVAWAFSVVAVAGMGRAVNDPPVFRSGELGSVFFTIENKSAEIATAAALAVGLVYWLSIIVPALRRHERSIWLPAIAPAGFVAAWAAITIILSFVVPLVVGRDHIGTEFMVGFFAFLLLYVGLTLLCVLGCIVSVVLVIHRANLSERQLRPGIAVAAMSTVALVIESVAALLCFILLLGHSGVALMDAAQPAITVAILVASAAAVSISSLRGVRALFA